MNDKFIIKSSTSDEEKYNLLQRTIKEKKLFYVPLIPHAFDFKVGYNSTGIQSFRAGVYLLGNRYEKIVNIGATANLKVRVTQKMSGKSSGSIADMYFKDFYFNAKGYYIDSYIDRVLMEIYLINLYKPILNYYYAYYDKSIYRALIKGFSSKSLSSTDAVDFKIFCNYIAGREVN